MPQEPFEVLLERGPERVYIDGRGVYFQDKVIVLRQVALAAAIRTAPFSFHSEPAPRKDDSLAMCWTRSQSAFILTLVSQALSAPFSSSLENE